MSQLAPSGQGLFPLRLCLDKRIYPTQKIEALLYTRYPRTKLAIAPVLLKSQRNLGVGYITMQLPWRWSETGRWFSAYDDIPPKV